MLARDWLIYYPEDTGLFRVSLDDSLPVQTISTGVAFTVAALRSLGIIRSLHIDLNRVNEYLEKTESRFFYFVTRETVDPAARLHARMLFYKGEDPATGSAAGCAAGWKGGPGLFKTGEGRFLVEGVGNEKSWRTFVVGGRIEKH